MEMPALAIPVDLMEYLRKKNENMKPYLNSDVLVRIIEYYLERGDTLLHRHSRDIHTLITKKLEEFSRTKNRISPGEASIEGGEETKPAEREAREEKEREAGTKSEGKKPGKSEERKPKESGKEASLKKLLTKS